MKSVTFIGLLTIGLVMGSCSNGKGKQEKAPIRVKTEVLQSTSNGTSQSYVGIVEEREGTAVSFTSMGVVRRMLVNEGQDIEDTMVDGPSLVADNLLQTWMTHQHATCLL